MPDEPVEGIAWAQQALLQNLRQAPRAPGTPGTHADELREQASGLRKQSLALLRRADLEEHEARLGDAFDAAVEAQYAAEAEAGRLAALVRPLILAERDAEDRGRDAAGYARATKEAEAAGRGKASPAEQAEALKTMRAAAEVAVREQASYEGAQTARKAAEVVAGQARTVLAEKTAERDRAEAVMDNPGRTPVSAKTIIAEPALSYLKLWDSMTAEERVVLGYIMECYAKFTGGADAIRRAAAEAALAGAVSQPAVSKGGPLDGRTILPPDDWTPPVAQPGKDGPALAFNQGNQHRGDVAVFHHPRRQPLQ